MALSKERLTARYSALTDAAELISSHDTGPFSSDPELHSLLEQERKKVAHMLNKKAEKLRRGRSLLDFECD